MKNKKAGCILQPAFYVETVVSEKFYLSKPQLDYIQTKRDFLNLQIQGGL